MTPIYRNAICLVAALVSAVSLAPACRAGSLTARLGTYTDNINIMTNNADGGAVKVNMDVGAFTWTTQTSSGSPYISGVFTAFCIQLGGPGSSTVPTVNQGSTYAYTTSAFSGSTPGMNANSAAAISRLWGGFYDQLNTYNYSGSVNAKVNAAAFQLAIWSLEYNLDGNGKPTATTFTSGTFQAAAPSGDNGDAANAIALAVDLVSKSIEGGSFTTPATNLVALCAPSTFGYQNQLTATPEPSTLCLGAIGIGMLITAGVRRRRKAVVA
jgi:PEP-CTERM motif